ncbi:ROK family transcriptional regulator [Kitasatospora griseola]|uniref:ROK family transcriptional regulator n=1 Tax=Kitasatospora griseola TaxID=2064 RepID=A0A0D0NX78_KITGR|nr:ROK family protein [Kitasatospora griseola]KIQ63836.1 ROK family transcriptional regulator [Kitasatospora griseola]
MPGPLLAALDIGGTKIAGGLVDPRGALLHRLQVPTPATGDRHELMAAVTHVLDELARRPEWPRVRALGIGSAGPVDIAAGTVSPVNLPGWREFPLRSEAATHPAVRDLPVVLGGDAVAMTAAEHWRGAARPYRNALCLVVSTGVGAGLVLDGRLHTGTTGNAGHLGHISVDFEGRPCPCGARVCLEGLASGTAIARTAADSGWRPGPDGDTTATGVATAAKSGDPLALAAFDRAAQALAAGIAATATLVELDVAVIGGGVAAAGDILFTPLARHLSSYATLPFTRSLHLVPARLGTDAGLVGAAALARRALLAHR